MTVDPPWEPPLAGSESEHLIGMLERLRATFRWKADGLDRAGLTATVGPSTMTLGGLLKHLAVVEDDIFCWRIAGEAPVTWLSAPEGTDPAVWQFEVTDQDTPEQLYGLWDAAVERSRARWADIIERGELDGPGAMECDGGGMHPSNRRHVCDLIEEYGRHAGHADLLREAVDGRVGEDPPPDWRPGG